jgi:hypothetical protein
LKNKESGSFVVVFDSGYAKCNGKLLEAPKIVYGNNSVLDVRRGSWNLMNVKAYRPVDGLCMHLGSQEQMLMNAYEVLKILQGNME